jgi:hypothetical protein
LENQGLGGMVPESVNPSLLPAPLLDPSKVSAGAYGGLFGNNLGGNNIGVNSGMFGGYSSPLAELMASNGPNGVAADTVVQDIPYDEDADDVVVFRPAFSRFQRVPSPSSPSLQSYPDHHLPGLHGSISNNSLGGLGGLGEVGSEFSSTLISGSSYHMSLGL